MAAAVIPVVVLLPLNTLRFAEETLAHPGMYQLGALPVGAGIAMTHQLIPADATKRGTVIFADVDEWTIDSLAGELLPVDRNINAAKVTFVPSGGANYLLFGDATHPITSPIHAENSATFDFGNASVVQR